MLEKICKNCKFLGALADEDILTCSRNGFEEVFIFDTCEKFQPDFEFEVVEYKNNAFKMGVKISEH